MGKLIDRIERVQKSSGTRLGFAPPTASKQPSMVLIAVLPSSDAGLASAAIGHGADAVMVREVSARGGEAVAKALKVASQIPVGAMLKGRMTEHPASDFIVVDVGSSASALGEGEDIDVVLSLGFDLPDPQLRTLEALPVDALIVPAPEGELTLDNLAAYYRVTRSSNKPVLSYVLSADATTLRLLRDAGIAGFLMAVPDAGAADAVGMLRRAIDQLPPKKTKRNRGRDVATVGMPISMGLNRQREPVEPDEDDDDEP